MEIDGNIIYDCLMKEILVQYHIDAFHKNIYTVVSKARRVYTDTAMEELLKSTSAAPVYSDRFMCRGDGERPGHQEIDAYPRNEISKSCFTCTNLSGFESSPIGEQERDVLSCGSL